MGQALEVYVNGQTIEVPKGCSANQVRLAALTLRFDENTLSWYDMMLQAGYTRTTALASAKRAFESAGVQRALTVLKKGQADSARGLINMGHGLLASANHDELSDRDKVFLGLAAVKQGHEVGESIEPEGNAGRWYQRQRRGLRLAYHFGSVATRRAIEAETHKP